MGIAGHEQCQRCPEEASHFRIEGDTRLVLCSRCYRALTTVDKMTTTAVLAYHDEGTDLQVWARPLPPEPNAAAAHALRIGQAVAIRALQSRAIEPSTPPRPDTAADLETLKVTLDQGDPFQ